MANYPPPLSLSQGSDDPLHLKPNPGNMTSKFKDQEEDNSESDLDSDMERSSSKKEGGVYKPPMMSAAYFGQFHGYEMLILLCLSS